jgi:hypothetical protein
MDLTSHSPSSFRPAASAPAPAESWRLTADEVVAARERLGGALRLTPCSPALGLRPAGEGALWLKRDDLQVTGSFKERGARHALELLDADGRKAGVVAASAGNHALGLAYHGRELGVPVTLVMATTAARVKVERCRALGARVFLAGEDFAAASEVARHLARESGARFVHPFDDVSVMAGQGTVALEVLEQVPDLEAVVVPVGGGRIAGGCRGRHQIPGALGKGGRSRTGPGTFLVRRLAGRPALHSAGGPHPGGWSGGGPDGRTHVRLGSGPGRFGCHGERG